MTSIPPARRQVEDMVRVRLDQLLKRQLEAKAVPDLLTKPSPEKWP